jgi:hypothetical protein
MFFFKEFVYNIHIKLEYTVSLLYLRTPVLETPKNI